MEIPFEQLLILMIAVWSVAVLLRKLGIPTVMGELLMGVILGPAVLGWVQPNHTIEILAQMGIFFLMLHAGIETKPREFFKALKISWGIALVGAIVPFIISMTLAILYGLNYTSAAFIGLCMTATAVIVSIKILRELGMQHTTVARVIVAVGIIDSLISLILFSILMGIVEQQSITFLSISKILFNIIIFFSVSIIVGYYIYPFFKHPFTHKRGKGFSFVLILALASALFADYIGLHFVIGAYMAGLFFEEKVAHPILVEKVTDRVYAFAYSFLGPIFFVSLGFSITFDPFMGTGTGWWFIIILTLGCMTGQILSASCMARLLRFKWPQAITIGIGMCARAEMLYILAALGLGLGIIDKDVFSVLIFTSFLLNILTAVGLKLSSIMYKKDR